MTNGEAIQKFFEQFLTAYPVTAVPDNAKMPYLTYTSVSDYFGSTPSVITVNMWFRTTSEALPNAKSDELGNALGRGGVLIHTDDGAIWLKRGNPWSQSVVDDDTTVKRRYINILAEFLTIE